jgi:hypothetical protein
MGERVMISTDRKLELRALLLSSATRPKYTTQAFAAFADVVNG